jgi:Fic family protein
VPDWEADSPELRRNVSRALAEGEKAAEKRETPTLELAKRWHTLVMEGLTGPGPKEVGAFRGEPGLEFLQNRVGPRRGVYSQRVADELASFEEKLQRYVAALDAEIQSGQFPNVDQTSAIVDLCAWAHAEWVRIHPFGNGNGRTARLWANFIASRYMLPSFVRLRPRPGGRAYEDAGIAAMEDGNWEPTAAVFRRFFNDFFGEE